MTTTHLHARISRCSPAIRFASARAILIGIASSVAISVAHAQQHAARVGFGGGFSVPTAYADSTFKTGWHGQGFLLLNLGPLLHLGTALPAIRLDLGYQRFNFKQALAPGAPSAPDSGLPTSSILSALGTIHLDLIGSGRIRPYLLAGLGVFRVGVDSAREAGSASQTHFGIDGGGGIAFSLGRVDLFVEGKVQNVYTNQGLIDSKSIRYIPITFGVIY